VDDARLSQLATQWSLVLQACRGTGDDARALQSEVLERYCGAIYRYALRILADPDLAAEACQEFALRFVRGDFQRANPAQGRFRDYVKVSVIHLIDEFRRTRQRGGKTVPLDDRTATAAPDPGPLAEAEFQALWRKELLNRAWDEMGRRQSPTGPPYFAALRMKADQPDLVAAALAGRLESAGQGKYNDAGVRQVLHRARQIFADLLLDEIARSILSDDPADLDDELVELDLLIYCREALARRKG
jgi:DNA-directed RNA polymerase specialized sigma24 family protein